MSVWTHINGSIRVDWLPIFPAPNFGAIFSDTPHGSEYCEEHDDLVITIIKNKEKGSISVYAINIKGDLRDYSDVESINTWFESVCKAFDLIRMAVLEVEVEGDVHTVSVWKDDKLITLYVR
jgi:hypothetical protein